MIQYCVEHTNGACGRTIFQTFQTHEVHAHKRNYARYLTYSYWIEKVAVVY